MKKQNLFLVLLSVFLLSLAACGQKESQTGKGDENCDQFLSYLCHGQGSIW